MEVPAIVGLIGIADTAAVETVEAAIAVAAMEGGRDPNAAAMEATKTSATTVETATMEASSMETADSTAMEAAASTMESTAVKAATAASTETTTATVVESTAMAASATMPKLNRQRIACGFRGGHRTRADRRQRFSALLRGDRQHEDRGRCNTDAAQQPASQITFTHS